MGYNKGIDVGLGQLGSGFNNDSFDNLSTNVSGSGVNTVAIEPPAGKVIASITFLESTRIRELVPETSTDATFKGPRVLATGVSEINYFSTEAQTAANGSNSDRLSGITNSYITVMPKGIVIFGRWKKLMIQDSKGQSLANAGVTPGVITTYSY